jgi:uncharacterized membrane protein
MNRYFSWAIVALVSSFSLTACFKEVEKKPVGPTSANSPIPWNQPVSGQGQGQFGMLPQNQTRR